MSDLLQYLINTGMKPVKAGNKHGGEYHSGCPFCGSDDTNGPSDRFSVWPDQTAGSRGGTIYGGAFWCRKCGKHGDGISFLMETQGMDFRSAARECGKPLDDNYTAHPHRLSDPVPRKPDGFTPSSATRPSDIWIERAEKFVAASHAALMTSRPDVLGYLARRGLPGQTVQKFRIGYNPQDQWRPRSAWGLPDVYHPETGKPKKVWLPAGIVIPIMDPAGAVIRLRIRTDSGKPKYYAAPGSGSRFLVCNPNAAAHIAVEADLDAMAVDAAAGDTVCAVGVGNNSAKPCTDVHELLKNAKAVLIALDADGTAAKDFRFWQREYSAEPWPVPVGKDPGEAFERGVDLRVWVLAGLPPVFHVPAGSPPPQRIGGASESAQERGGAGFTPSPPMTNAPAPGGPASGPPPHPAVLDRFYEYLAKYPIQIVSTESEIGIRYAEGLHFSDSVKAVSQLLYKNKVIWSYVCCHPADLIHRGNFWAGGAK